MKILLFGEMSGLIKLKLNSFTIVTNVTPKDTIAPVKHGGGSIVWRCFAAGETGALHKTDQEKENDVDILKLNTSARKLKHGHKWVFYMDNDSKQHAAKWLQDNKVKALTS